MKKSILFLALTLCAGMWAQDRNKAVEDVNNAASAAIAEIQGASTEAVAKPIQDKAIADINETKDAAIWEIATTQDEFGIDAVKTWAIIQINDIKVQALKEIKGGTESGETIAQRDSLYSYFDDVLMAKTFYTYNDEGELAQRYFIKVEYGITDIPYVLDVYDYNEAGLLTSRKTYDFVEDAQGEWQKVLSEELQNQYNALGQLVKDTVTTFCEEDTTIYGSNIYQYNEEGYLIELVKYECITKGETIVEKNTIKTEITYTANNQLSQEILYLKQPDSQWLLQTTTTYTYDENNLLIEVVEVDEYKEDSKMVYTYNDNNCLITKTGYTRSENEWELASKEEYTYDEHNNVKSDEIFVYGDGEWEPRYKWLDTYTEEGWLETDTCYIYQGSYHLYYIAEYTYDVYGNLLLLVSADYLGEELLGVDKHQYFYSYPSTGFESIHDAQCTMHSGKYLRNGQLFIRKNGKTYNAMGIEF